MNVNEGKNQSDDTGKPASEIAKPSATRKIPVIDLGSARLETKGSFGGFADHPSRGNFEPPIRF